MISKPAEILIFLSVCGIIVSNPDRAIDCRKFVFAPLCRGVAAKRNLPSSEHYEPATITNNESAEEFLRTLASLGIKVEEANQSGILAKTQKEIKNAREMGNLYQQDKIKRILRLVANKRIISERDNIPVQEFDNL